MFKDFHYLYNHIYQDFFPIIKLAVLFTVSSVHQALTLLIRPCHGRKKIKQLYLLFIIVLKRGRNVKVTFG
jgi:hypothetical protein